MTIMPRKFLTLKGRGSWLLPVILLALLSFKAYAVDQFYSSLSAAKSACLASITTTNHYYCGGLGLAYGQGVINSSKSYYGGYAVYTPAGVLLGRLFGGFYTGSAPATGATGICPDGFTFTQGQYYVGACIGSTSEPHFCPIDTNPAWSFISGTGCQQAIVDTDGDTIADAIDNCPFIANLTQLDGDNDNIGDACDTCNLNQYNHDVSQVADSIKTTIPANYCNAQLCLLNKISQNCTAPNCTANYQSTGATCMVNNTPADWSVYFQVNVNNQADLNSYNNSFSLSNGLSALTALNPNQNFKITNCVRSGNPVTLNVFPNFSDNPVACTGFQGIDQCVTPAQIDEKINTYIRENPLILTVLNEGIDYYYRLSTPTLVGDGNLGIDAGTGAYTATIEGFPQWHGNGQSSPPYANKWKPFKLFLTGCTNGSGGGAGTGSGGLKLLDFFSDFNAASAPSLSKNTEISEAKTTLGTHMDAIKADFANSFSPVVTATDYECEAPLHVDSLNADISFCLEDYKPQLEKVGQGLMFAAYLLAFLVVFK